MRAAPGPQECSGRGWEALGEEGRGLAKSRRPEGSAELLGEKNVTWAAMSSGQVLLSHPKQAPSDGRPQGPGT